MNPFWLVLIIPAVAAVSFGLGLVCGLWDPPDDGEGLYGSPEDPFPKFPE